MATEEALFNPRNPVNPDSKRPYPEKCVNIKI
jgi:hypothetical protein